MVTGRIVSDVNENTSSLTPRALGLGVLLSTGIGVGACYTEFDETVTCEAEFIDLIKEGRFHGVDCRWQDNRPV